MEKKERELCSRCIALLKESFKVTELGRREKLLCSNCGKKHYGCKCRIERK